VFSWAVVSEGFLRGQAWNSTAKIQGLIPPGSDMYNKTIGLGYAVIDIQNDYLANSTSFQNLTNYECLLQSEQVFGWRPNVPLISSDTHSPIGLPAPS
jgi:hypothetical protein